MGNTKHQHFIPRSYLKNFAIELEEGKFFVEAKHKSEELPKAKLLSIKNICVDKNIYTLPFTEGEEKYVLEKYYADNVDAIYPSIYRLLVNPDIVDITLEQKKQIITTTMSLFFRTPKFLNLENAEAISTLNYAAENHKDEFGNVDIELGEYQFKFHVNDIDNQANIIRIRNKVKFLKSHLEEWRLFVQAKMKCGICVFKVSDEVKLITSDNPVAIHSALGLPLNIFDPSNMIRFPLDPNHFFVIIPDIGQEPANRIYRAERDKRFAITTNRDMEDASEDWILGLPGTIHAHLKDQIDYNAETPENLQYIEDIKEKMADSVELLKIVHEVGGIAHQRVADKVRELRKKPINKDNFDLKKWIRTLEENGFSTE